MRLYFLRHAQAEDQATWVGEEPVRPLTEKGRRQAEAVGEGFASMRPGIEAIISSPFARAYETALIVGRHVGLVVETADDLAPGFDLPRFDHALTLRPSVESLLLVGHEPDLSSLIMTLMAHPEGKRERVDMAKASCCFLATPHDVPGGASVAELAGRCAFGWLRTWHEMEALARGDDAAH